MEGPSLVILKEELRFLKGQRIMSAIGNAKIEMDRINNQKLIEIRSFGKHLLLVFPKFFVRIHFLMFGSYRINEKKDTPVRLSLCFAKAELNFYSCAVALVDEDVDSAYDWSADVMSDKWDEKKAKRKLKKQPEMNVGDALLDQSIFAGVGNIIKNEVLFRIMVHPESTVGALPPRKLTALIKEACVYSYDFFHWKKAFELRKHWLIYKKKKCKRCNVPVLLKHTGNTPRRSFYCEDCQVLYV